MRKTLPLLCLFFCASFALVGAAAAQGDASAKVSDPERAAELTAQALALLDKGEASDDDKERLAVYTEGEKLAREATELDDKSADAQFALFGNLGRRVLLEGGLNPFNLVKVNRALDRVLALNPDHSDALAARGGMYRQLPRLMGGNLRKAEDDLRRSIELDPTATGARIELARTYKELGEDEKVVPLLQEALVWAGKLNKPRRVREAQQALAEIAGK